MKYLYSLILINLIFFNGCTSVMSKQAAEEAIKSNGLDNHVTVVCYDIINKKKCPTGTMQLDINILPFIPFSSRFCFGVTREQLKLPVGMYCYTRDLIKGY